MTGPPSRLAVQVGGRTVRVAGAVVGGEPWLLAEQPEAGPDTAAELLSELLGPVPEELVIVHPASWSTERVAAVARDLEGLAGRLRTVPGPVAAASTRPMVVLDIGHTGTEVCRLGGDGSIVCCRGSPVGGAQLDAVLARWLRSTAGAPSAGTGPEQPPLLADWPPDSCEPTELVAARRIRERLSLLPVVDAELAGLGRTVRIQAPDAHAVLTDRLRSVAELVRAVAAADGPVPVLVIGGLARTPLLVELLDAVGCAEVVVAPRPDAAAVLGALCCPPAAPDPPCARGPQDAGAGNDGTDGSTAAAAAAAPATAPGPGPAVPASWWRPAHLLRPGRRAAPGDPVPEGPPEVGSDPRPRYFPPPQRRSRRTALLTLVATALAAGLFGSGLLLFPPASAVAGSAGTLVQYGYRFEIPAGWEHTGGLPERRRVLLTPVAAPEGSAVIAVERSPLGYDAGAEAERPRALAELRAEYEAAVAGGSALTGYRSDTIGGRDAVRYEQRDPDGRRTVDWFVLLEGDAQFSVGCRYHPAGAAEVRAACALVVGSVRAG